MAQATRQILYDANCPMCTRAAQRLVRSLGKQGWSIAPLSVPANEMAVITEDGRTLWGVDALLHLAQIRWFTWPVYALGRVSLMRSVICWIYRHIAANRYCLSRVCKKTERGQDAGGTGKQEHDLAGGDGARDTERSVV